MSESFLINKLSGTFILNLRGISVGSDIKSDEDFKKYILEVTYDEIEKFKKFSNIMNDHEFVKRISDEGWFNKTYSTVRSYISNYLSKQSGKKLHYNVVFGKNISSKELICKHLFFCELMGKKVALIEIHLSDEQKLVVNQTKGVCVYNSGPGSGKTTTAVHKTSKLMDDGVIVVSFTVAAVKNFHCKLLGIIDDISKISEKPENKIYLCTIDEISRIPFPKKTQINKDYSKQIQAARNEKETYKEIFSNSVGKLVYKHIIIDEAQDVDDARFSLLMEIYNYCDFESITIIGDPRQRLNINAGGVFQKLLKSGTENINECKFTFENPLVVKSRITYRYENPLLISLCNILSEMRPEIHVEMSSKVSEIKPEKIQKLDEISAFQQIQNFLNDGVCPSEIAVISPLIEAESKVKNTYMFICDKLRSLGISVSDKIQVESIYSSSIQKVKGLEFDYVFFVGCSDFPKYMNKTYSDINDGMSLNFVANTRAKKRIFYVTDETFRIPIGVPEEFTEGEKSKEEKVKVEIHPYAIKSEDIQIEEYEKMETNMRVLFSIPKNEDENYYFNGSQNLQNFKYEIISSVLMKLDGMTTPMTISKEIPKEKSVYYQLKNKCFIFDLRSTNSSVRKELIFWNEEDKPLINEIYRKYSFENVDKHKIFKFVMTRRKSSLTCMDQIAEAVIKISDLLEKYKGNYCYKQNIIQARITASLIENEKIALIFTDCTYVGLYYKKLNPNKIVYTVSLLSGKFYIMGKPIYSLKRYEYQIHFIYSLFYHFKLMRGSGKYSISSFDSRNPELVIDSEFQSRFYNKSNTIYDFCVININDPFLSIATYLQSDSQSFANRFDGCGDKNLSYSDFIACPNFILVSMFLKKLYSDKKPILHYFNATADLAFFYETDPEFLKKINSSRKIIYDNILNNLENEKIKNCIKNIFEKKSFEQVFAGELKVPEELNSEEVLIFYDMMRKIEIGNDNDLWKFDKNNFKYNFVDQRNTRKGTQSEIYMKECQRALAEFEHLPLHISFPDALILTEIVIKRKNERK